MIVLRLPVISQSCILRSNNGGIFTHIHVYIKIYGQTVVSSFNTVRLGWYCSMSVITEL
jgi:hypothetical protein